MKYYRYRFVIQLLLSVTMVQLFSCSTGSCFEETESFVKASFYNMGTGKPLAPDSLTLYGIDRDTNKLYNREAKLLTAKFPLFASDTTCTFIIRINGITDTLKFTYDSYSHLISKECGYTFFYTIEEPFHSTNAIDSISIRKNTITTNNEENIRIFY